MLHPPFKLTASINTAPAAFDEAAPQSLSPNCCDSHDSADGSAPQGRTRLSQLDMNFHCSVIGTCLTTPELRKLMGRFLDVQGASDLDVHHEAVRLVAQSAAVAKALQKALDHRHEPVMQRFSKLQDGESLAKQWEEALRQSEIPGAYWAVLTHRKSTTELRQKAFGDVHMLSHLVGAANRADIRRLAALQLENSDWRERWDHQQARIAELQEEQQTLRRECERRRLANSAMRSSAGAPDGDVESLKTELRTQSQLVALQTQRREAAEQSLALALVRQEELQVDADRTRQLNETLSRELQSAESHLQALAEPRADGTASLGQSLEGWKVLYVGGRPSSTPAIRKLVTDSGAEFVHHDGGMEDRKGLLAGALAGASIVAFPVDCVDHDSVTNLKRLCARHEVPFLALRTASVTCFAAALSALAADAPPKPSFRICLRHG